MVCLSAHSQCAHALKSSKCGGLFSSARATAATLCPLGDRRVCSGGRRLTIECNLGKKFDDAGACTRRDIRLQCSRVAAAEALPPSVEDLEERFGQAGVKFVEAAGYKILEMRLKEGSSARIVLQNALVSSYKCRMWHGGVEELLHTIVVPGMDESQRPTMVGGVALRVWEPEAGRDSNLVTTDCWDVENVRSDPAKFVQVTLSTTYGACIDGANSAGYVLQFKYIITLTEATLSCAVITTNVGNSAISLHGSLETSVAVNFVDGVYALGLQGYKFLPMPPPNTALGSLSLNTEKSSVDDTKIEEGIFSKLKRFSRIGNYKKRNDNSSASDGNLIVEEEEMVRLKGGFDRLYTVSPDCMSLLDRGKRRTINFLNSGFEDIRLSNPGEESGLEDWDALVSIELARSSRPVHLQPDQEWRAAQQLENPSK